jgi:hypothetical protein
MSQYDIEIDALSVRFAAFAIRKNESSRFTFFFIAARVAGQSPKGSKAANSLIYEILWTA